MAAQHDEQALNEAERLGYEPRDANYTAVTLLGIGLVMLVAVSFGVVFWFLSLVSQTEAEQDVVFRREQVPLPEPEQHANQKLTRIEQEQALGQLLESYGWVDRERRVARIPIERAMEILAEQERLSVAFDDAKGGDER